ISLNGVPVSTWSLEWTDVAVGDYRVGVPAVEGFLDPDVMTVRRCDPDCAPDVEQSRSQPLVVRAAETTEVRVPYDKPGFLRVTTSGTQSRGPIIFVNGQSAGDWGIWLSVRPGR